MKQSSDRRKVLRRIVASGGVITVAGGLPGHWKRPVLNAVALPAHAETTGPVIISPPKG
jgi:hypothetical protein